METKEHGDAQEDCSSSPYQVLQHISEEAVRVAGEALQSVYLGSSGIPPLAPGHRRSQSEVLTATDRRNNSFQKWKSQMQRALRWGNSSQEQSWRSSFNPEVLANQKRQWCQRHSKTLDHKKYKEPTSLFEHFIIAGIHPYANLEAVEDAFAKRKKWELQMEKSEMIDFKMLQHRGPSLPTSEPQILFKYPPGKSLAMRLKDIAAFCFPGGIKARVLERTPSLSDLNELVYGQEHLGRDDLSFIFSLKVADNATLYGVCLHVQEIVQRPPAIFGGSSPLNQSSGLCSRFLVSAPRCYCVLTRVPFFELHYEMLNSSVRSDDEDDEIYLSHEKDAGDEIIMEWARENKNDLLQIVCGYHTMLLPLRGSEIVFQPLEHLQAIQYRRPPVSALGLNEKYLDKKLQDSAGSAEVNLKLAAAEEAVALSIWTTATICRVLSLESVLALLTGVLLEKQVVVVCPNLGVLSAIVLSLIPMICPFEWQSLFLPVLPGKMLEFLDAPVPFIVGIQHKPADLKMKTSNLVHVNVVKDQVKMCYLPALPRHKELISELAPIHARMSRENSIAKRHPVHKCNEVQAEAAAEFLSVIRCYLESLCSDLRSHTITSVQSNSDRVSLLLKDSFIDSFPVKDRSFIKLFVDTQLFTVLSDSRLSSYETEH
ncbi:hypothetical protein F0562_002375 [Nyssa sinensis]|uniref:UDENN domain-containing protein n=1 Tax=Nyssa sinensis TaxID=561372 RepID=A0A5J5CAM0_9ASTE|nr:hypothetical protein F0562_002375 [Nyssa sinensis]